MSVIGTRGRLAGQRGLTLIEVMVVVIIIGVIASVALPTYDRYMREARRSDARSALTRIAAQQAEYVLNHAAYADDVTLLGIASTSENGFYGLVVSATGATAFTATANAVGEQSDDTRCATFSITHTGAKTARTSGNSDSTAGCW